MSVPRILPLTSLDRARFCELATAIARERDPSFPALEPEPMPVVETAYCASFSEHDARRDGRGWVFAIREEDVGPGEAIHRERWSASAHGDGWVVRLRLTSDPNELRAWVEPERQA